VLNINLSNYLVEWIEIFLKNKDLIHRRIKSIKKLENSLIVTYQDREHIYIVVSQLNKDVLDKLNKNHCSIVCYNTKENIQFLKSNWQSFAELPKFSLFFVNPFSKVEKRWIIYPRTHQMLSDDINQGIDALANGVEVIPIKEVEKILK
jgi:hypothetical protein